MFFFQITYFKPNGKYYTGIVVEWDIEALSNDSTVAYYHDAVAKVRGLRDCGGPGAMPGLNSDGWDGSILIEQAVPKEGASAGRQCAHGKEYCPDDFHVDGVPTLLLPRGQDA